MPATHVGPSAEVFWLTPIIGGTSYESYHIHMRNGKNKFEIAY